MHEIHINLLTPKTLIGHEHAKEFFDMLVDFILISFQSVTAATSRFEQCSTY
jgi:hypothetical protein